MDLKSIVLQEHSKAQTDKIVRWVGKDPVKFKNLMHLFLKGDATAQQRSGWPMSYIVEKHPQLFIPYIKSCINNLENPVHGAVRRNTIRALQYIQVPEKYQGLVTNKCFELLASPNEEIAVKAFAMTVLYNICKQHPELSNELEQQIKLLLPEASAGIKSRGLKVIKSLSKLSSIKP